MCSNLSNSISVEEAAEPTEAEIVAGIEAEDGKRAKVARLLITKGGADANALVRKTQKMTLRIFLYG